MNPEIKCEDSDEHTMNSVDIKTENNLMDEHSLQKCNVPSYESDTKMNEYQ